MSKVRVGIIFGGRSAEHEVSLQSARNIVDALDRSRFEPVLIGIDKAGHWHLNDTSNFLINQENPALIASTSPTANWRWCRARPASKWWKPPAAACWHTST